MKKRDNECESVWLESLKLIGSVTVW